MHLTFDETPIQAIPLVFQENHFYIKRDDLLPFSFGGNKVRIANAFLEEMESGDYDCMITYGQSKSNLCRVVANFCASQHMECYVVSPLEEGASYVDTANSRLVKSFGAKVIPCPKTAVAETLQSLISSLEAEGKHPYYVYGNIYGKGREAVACTSYRKAYPEIHNYMEKHGSFDYLFHASATGTTQAGLLAGIWDAKDMLPVMGISVARPEEAGVQAIQANLEAMNVPSSEVPIHFLDAYRDGGYGMAGPKIRQTILDVMETCGVPLDPTYTGKAFCGMLTWLKENDIHGKKILFLHTGGTPLYFDFIHS